MNERPQTAEQIAALPKGPAFGVETRIVDGKKVAFPIMPRVVATYASETDLIGYTDDNGVGWTLGRYADGRWFRQRRNI